MEVVSATWIERGKISFQQSKFRAAALEFRVGIIISPSSSHAMLMFARSLELVNQHSPHRHYARKAVILSPGTSSGWLARARGLFGWRDLPKALRAVRNFSLLSPEILAGPLLMSRIQFQHGNTKGSLRTLERAVKIAPLRKDVCIAHARCLFRLARYGAALQASNKALSLGASLKEYGFDHCRIARAADQYEIVKPLLQKITQMDARMARRRQALELTVTVGDLRPKRLS